MKKQTTQGFHSLDTPIRSSYAVQADPHGQSVLADRVQKAHNKRNIGFCAFS